MKVHLNIGKIKLAAGWRHAAKLEVETKHPLQGYSCSPGGFGWGEVEQGLKEKFAVLREQRGFSFQFNLNVS